VNGFSRHLGRGDALPEHGRARLPSELEISLGGIQLPHGEFFTLRNTRKSLKIAKSAPLTGKSFKINFLRAEFAGFIKLSTSFLIFFFSIELLISSYLRISHIHIVFFVE
jgi:hypothetical protein